jgi:hypothetical protein
MITVSNQTKGVIYIQDTITLQMFNVSNKICSFKDITSLMLFMSQQGFFLFRNQKGKYARDRYS